MSAADEVVERVARAIYATRPIHASGAVLSWGDIPPQYAGERKFEQARAAIAAMPGWAGIESAPKDGTRFLGAVDGETRTVAWGKTSHVPLYGFCLADQGPEDFDLCNPTHWQPLPAPP